MTGTIARVTDRGFGFIKPDEGDDDLFFHANALTGVSFDEVREGDAVTFDIEEGPKGPAATNVAPQSGAAADDAATDEESAA